MLIITYSLTYLNDKTGPLWKQATSLKTNSRAIGNYLYTYCRNNGSFWKVLQKCDELILIHNETVL